jgi:lipopolysaccharide biosynthesis glycosyltransferase
MSSKTIPIFYAADDNYAPYLAVSVTSLIANADKEYFYDIHVLTSPMSEENKRRIGALSTEYASITFDDMGERIKSIADKVSIRDYYSMATYFRIFIANMFPEYDKALYIDSDTVAVDDVAKLFNTDIGDALIGGMPENVMLMDVFSRYSSIVLGVPNTEYFNAGLVLMNLEQFRATKMESRFIELLSRRKFPVAQDQDYLNLLCHGRVHYLPVEWNLDPVDIYKDKTPRFIHYKMHRRPWYSDGILFGEHFWAYTVQSGYHDEIVARKNARTEADSKRDEDVMQSLCELAESEVQAVVSGKEPCAKVYVPPIE